MNFHMFRLNLEKSEESEIKLPTSAGYTKAFDYVDHNKLWEILKETGIPDHLTRLLRNLYSGQEATIRTELETTDCKTNTVL